MNWKKYETEILEYFQETYPETDILFDQKIQGKYSKVSRQIDILIEGEIAGYAIRIAVDCKCFSKKIDVKQVESFCSMVEDVDAHQGILITQKGFSKAAINRAHYGNQKVELDIINFDELKEFQSLEAIPYVGHFGVTVPAPFGWVLDLVDRINSFATIHQRGLTLKEAQKNNEWMYMQFWKRENSKTNIDSLIEIQNKNILEVDNKTTFSYKSNVKRSDGIQSKIRIAEISKYPAVEVTGFIEFKNHILFIVLFTPRELLNKNIRKLQHILKVSTALHIDFDNTKAIQQGLESIEKSDNNEDKADRYFQIGDWYKEMDETENAFKNYQKGIECFPTHYTYLKKIIEETLALGLNDKAIMYSRILFEIEPKNPTAPQNLVEIFIDNKKARLLDSFFGDEIKRCKDDETIGNLLFHRAMLQLSINNIGKFKESLTRSRTHFLKALPREHYIFSQIKKALKEYK